MLPMFGILKGEKYVLLVLKKLIQIEKNIILSDSK